MIEPTIRYYISEWGIGTVIVKCEESNIEVIKRWDVNKEDGNNAHTEALKELNVLKFKRKENDFKLTAKPISNDCKRTLYTMEHVSGVKAEMAVYATDVVNVSEALKSKILKEIS